MSALGALAILGAVLAPAASAPAGPAPAAPALKSGSPAAVDSLAALQSALDAAVPGETITVKNGVYTADRPIAIRAAGDAGRPITLVAQTRGKVALAGTDGFQVEAPAAYVVIDGFDFENAAGTTLVAVDTRHVRVTRCVFHCPGDGADLTVEGDDAEIDHDEFRNKRGGGPMLAVGGAGGQVARRVWIHQDYFHDFVSAVGADAVMLRFGLAGLSGSAGDGLVEHNLFARCRGQTELVSNRSSANTYRYNTFDDSPSAPFTLRRGADCRVYANVFRRTAGLRIFGARHLVFSNYFENNYIGINIGNGDEDGSEGEALTGHDRPDRCIIAYNTLSDNRTQYQLSRRDNGLGATAITFADNLLVGGSVAVKLLGPYTGGVWIGNVVWTSADEGDLPDEGCAVADPGLAPGAGGILRPQPAGAAIASGEGSYPQVTVDLEGRPRPAKPSKGAVEPVGPAREAVTAPEDVGPAAP